MKQKILDFIKRRFPVDNNWLTGNCYFFALILNERFGGTIFYDVIKGHFLVQIDKEYYDYSGEILVDSNHLIQWDKFLLYDHSQYRRIIRDCIH